VTGTDNEALLGGQRRSCASSDRRKGDERIAIRPLDRPQVARYGSAPDRPAAILELRPARSSPHAMPDA
jgi:hypothetical protein